MKKLISALLIIAMLVSMVCVSTSAAVVLNADFKSWTNDQFYQQFMNGAFFVDDASGLLCGYYDAKALQSMYNDQTDMNVFDNGLNTWLTYDAQITFAMSDDDAVEYERFVTLAYCNDNLRVIGAEESRSFITFSYHIEKQQFDLIVSGSPTYDADLPDSFIAESVPMELNGDGDEFYTLGMSVEKNRIRCFCDDKLIFDLDATPYHVAESVNSPFFFWNNGNFIQISNIVVATAGHLYPSSSAPADTTAGGNNADATTTQGTTSEATTRIESEVVTNDKGETSIVTKVVTEATTTPKAETNNKPAGGSSTSTGDATFVVVAALVATLGCAVIVKKVSVR